MDGWKDDGGFARVAKCYTPSIHSFFILPYGCHMSPQFSQLQMTSLPIASSSPPGKPYPYPFPTHRALLVHSLIHSFTSHSHLTLSSPSLHTPLRTPPNPLAPIPPLQQLDSSPSPPRHSLLQPFSRYFTSPPPQIICTHPPAVHRYRKSIPRLLPPLLLYSNRSNYLSFSQCGHQL